MYRQRIPLLFLAMVATAALAACTSSHPELTKSEAREMSRRSDIDFCAERDWYDDGECDVFCQEPDPDCGGCEVGCDWGCREPGLDAACVLPDEYLCLRDLGVCERQDDGACDWTETPELTACVADPDPIPGCVVDGCAGTVCRGEDEEPVFTTCDRDGSCFAEHGTCERQPGGECDWSPSAALDMCLGEDPEPVFVHPSCEVSGCNSELCTNLGEGLSSACVALPEFACYVAAITECTVQTSGECGWTQTEELLVCLDESREPEPEPEPEPGPSVHPSCEVGGCNSELCGNLGDVGGSACVALPEFACYRDPSAACTVQPTGDCGWTRTEELVMCIEDARGGEPIECVTGGCSGQICYDSREESPTTTCEITPEIACLQEVGECALQADGACGWTPTDELAMCLEDA